MLGSELASPRMNCDFPLHSAVTHDTYKDIRLPEIHSLPNMWEGKDAFFVAYLQNLDSEVSILLGKKIPEKIEKLRTSLASSSTGSDSDIVQEYYDFTSSLATLLHWMQAHRPPCGSGPTPFTSVHEELVGFIANGLTLSEKCFAEAYAWLMKTTSLVSNPSPQTPQSPFTNIHQKVQSPVTQTLQSHPSTPMQTQLVTNSKIPLNANTIKNLIRHPILDIMYPMAIMSLFGCRKIKVGNNLIHKVIVGMPIIGISTYVISKLWRAKFRKPKCISSSSSGITEDLAIGNYIGVSCPSYVAVAKILSLNVAVHGGIDLSVQWLEEISRTDPNQLRFKLGAISTIPSMAVSDPKLKGVKTNNEYIEIELTTMQNLQSLSKRTPTEGLEWVAVASTNTFWLARVLSIEMSPSGNTMLLLQWMEEITRTQDGQRRFRLMKEAQRVSMSCVLRRAVIVTPVEDSSEPSGMTYQIDSQTASQLDGLYSSLAKSSSISSGQTQAPGQQMQELHETAIIGAKRYLIINMLRVYHGILQDVFAHREKLFPSKNSANERPANYYLYS